MGTRSKFSSSQFNSNAIDIDVKHIHLSTPPTLAENTVPTTKITADEVGTDSEAPKKSCTRYGPGRVTRRAQCTVVASDKEGEGHGCADPHCTETGNIEMVECTGPACGSKIDGHGQEILEKSLQYSMQGAHDPVSLVRHQPSLYQALLDKTPVERTMGLRYLHALATHWDKFLMISTRAPLVHDQG
ncbi:hypothetical protein FB451DRAFT_1174603 [Mycena latifolia]|nr:hypothetical protein FB451DRAFT_1174603 [Mycena latifolia]